ncbi:hypothetical protein ABIF65_004307 [Bradyrhizobium japonicum]
MSAFVMINNTALTRRRSDNPHEETWHIYSGDVRIGTIGVRAGVPVHADQWAWSMGFRADPGCLDSAPLDLSGFLPGYAERGALRFCRCVGRA